MLTDQEAMALSKLVQEPYVFPPLKEHIKRNLMDYYKTLLQSNQTAKVPTPRRWM